MVFLQPLKPKRSTPAILPNRSARSIACANRSFAEFLRRSNSPISRVYLPKPGRNSSESGRRRLARQVVSPASPPQPSRFWMCTSASVPTPDWFSQLLGTELSQSQLSQTQMVQLYQHYELLVRWNQRMN